MARTALLCTLSAYAASGCTDVVHVTLREGDCDSTIFSSVISARAQLQRVSDGLVAQRCVSADETPTSVADLEDLLAASIVFSDLPAGDTWSVRVQAYSNEGCIPKTMLLCGRVARIVLPGPGRIDVPIDCIPRVGAGIPPKIERCRDE